MEIEDNPLISPDEHTHMERSIAEIAMEGTSSKLSRRTLLSNAVKAGMGAGAFGPWLTACGGASGGPVTIQFAAYVDTTGEQTAEINKFNQLHAGKIKVDYLQLPPVATDQYNKFLATFQFQSSTPDVVQIDVTWPAQFAGLSWLAPLDQYVKLKYLDQFWPSARSVALIDGKLYGIQRFMDIGMLYYRTDLVEKYGGRVPQTREQMQDMAQQMLAHERANGIRYGYIIAGKKIEAVVDEWLELIRGSGETVGEPGKLVVNGPMQIAALQYMYDLIYNLQLAPPDTDTYSPNDILALFTSGQAPFMRNWTFAYTLANTPASSKVVGKVGVAPMLAATGHTGHGCLGGWVLAINAFSQHKDEAWQFIDYMLSKETQTSLSLHTGLISSRPDVVIAPAVQEKAPHFKQFATILDAGFNRPKLKNYNQFTTLLQAAINGVLGKQRLPTEALNEVQGQVEFLT